MTKLLFKRLDGNKNDLPSRGSESAAGMDLRAFGDHRIEPGQRILVKTGWAVSLPDGHYGRVAPRSGLAYKHGIDVLAGVIDVDYRGDIGVILLNTSDQSFVVETGDRIAQLIIEKCSYLDAEETYSLPESSRGAGGFGSTG